MSHKGLIPITNIGTKDVDFTVTATLAGSKNFKYLTADPSPVEPVVAKSADQVYEKYGPSMFNNREIKFENYK